MKLEVVWSKFPIVVGVIMMVIIVSAGFLVIADSAKSLNNTFNELGSKYNLSEYTVTDEDGYFYFYNNTNSPNFSYYPNDLKANQVFVIAGTEGNYSLCDMKVCGDPYTHESLLPYIIGIIILFGIVLFIMFYDDKSPEIKRLERELEIEYL